MAAKPHIRDFTAIVTRVVRETHDTSTLWLSAGAEPLDYLAGQFITIDPHQFASLAHWVAYLQQAKGKKELPRAYSLASAPHEGELGVTLKDEPFIPQVTKFPPLLSPLLVHQIAPGTKLTVRGFTGAYVLPEDAEARAERVVHLVAGSGVVPNFSILKDALNRRPKLRHSVFFSNKTWADVCFRQELDALQRAHSDRLEVTHLLTREDEVAQYGSNVLKGRLSLTLLKERVPEPSRCLFFVCGPAITQWERRAALEAKTQAAPKYLECVLEQLHELGVEKDRIRRESW